ncbi:MAG: CCA tRNA nucleotidyltransferase [Thermoguttaceae bacterium]
MSNPFLKDRKIKRILNLLLEQGATECLFIGGCVRDHLLEMKLNDQDVIKNEDVQSKDYDIEVYGLGYNEIVNILRPHFRVNLVGQSFATVKVDNTIDLNIPRRESKQGLGHCGFVIDSDPYLSPEEATARRDFTINSIGMRVDGTYFDPFHGRDDLEKGILRATSDAFCEDPLRVLRGMQFAARFGFIMDERTVQLSQKVYDEFPTLSAERVWGEWKKWAEKGNYPSRGLNLLRQTGWINAFPEIAALIGVPQNPKWHPEGDVYVHTCCVVDTAALIAREMQLDMQERLILLFAALCHNFGKTLTTVKSDKGNWKSPRHAMESVPLTESFLNRMKAPHFLLTHLKPLILEHMAHKVVLDSEIPPDRVIRRLSDRLVPSNIRMWSALARSDAHLDPSGQTRPTIDRWEEVAEKLRVREKRPQPILLGRDLIAIGIQPGREMGQILDQVYQRQLDGKLENREEALKWVRKKHPND